MKVLIHGGAGLVSTGISRLLPARRGGVTHYNRCRYSVSIAQGAKRADGRLIAGGKLQSSDEGQREDLILAAWEQTKAGFLEAAK